MEAGTRCTYEKFILHLCSGDEDENTTTFEHLSGRFLREDIELKASYKSKKPGKTKKPENSEKNDEWKFFKRDINQIEANKISYTPKSPPTNELELTPVGFLELFIDAEMVNLIVTQTNKYAVFKGAQFSVNEIDIKAFLTILMLSSYSDVYSKEEYWSTDPDTHNTLVTKLMSRNKFRDILKYVHVADNSNIDTDDRFFKVCEFLEIIRKKCLQYYMGQNTLSVDETMVPYFGRHSLKQYIKGKPIKFGFKMWALASHDGYVVNFTHYSGKTHAYNKEFGVGGQLFES